VPTALGLLATAGLLVTAASPASAQIRVPVPLTVLGNEARGVIALPGGIGAELTIAFEDVVGLTPTSLQAWASLIGPLDLGLLRRLPPGGQVIPPSGFPVLLEIEPADASALSFAGVARVSLYTLNLQLDRLVPLSLYSSSYGEAFRDITVSEGRGSYRVCGSSGGFSEFVIVINRQAIDSVIAGKFDRLQALLDEHASTMPEAVASVLQAHLSRALELFRSGATAGAIGEMVAFSRYVEAQSGTDIPDVWRANCAGLVNVAGLLRSAADTLKFSLDRKTGI
jgi:hypothetical protein